MKTLSILLLLAICKTAFGQITYDFSKGDFEDFQPIKNGEFVYLTIKNINTFRYKVEISGKSIEYVTPIPSELQTLFRLQSEEESTTASASEASEAVTETKSAAEQMNILKNTTATNPLKATLADVIEACNDYISKAKDVADIKIRRMILISLSKQHWENHSQLKAKLPVPLSRENMSKKFIEFSEAYHKVEALYRKAEIDAAPVSTEKAQVTAALEQIDEGYHKTEDNDFLKLIEDVIVLQDALENKNHFQVNSAPIQMDGDFVALKLKIEPTPTNSLMPFEHAREIPMEIPCKGGWKADFSVGPTFSFGSGSRDEIFELQPTTADSSMVTLKEVKNRSKTRPGLAAMIHAYPRSGKNASLGFMMGVGAGFKSTTDADISYYLGGSVVLGKRQKIMLNTGISYIPVDRLKSRYALDDTQYPVDAITIGELTSKTIKSAWFFSLSYNITNRIEIK